MSSVLSPSLFFFLQLFVFVHKHYRISCWTVTLQQAHSLSIFQCEAPFINSFDSYNAQRLSEWNNMTTDLADTHTVWTPSFFSAERIYKKPWPLDVERLSEQNNTTADRADTPTLMTEQPPTWPTVIPIRHIRARWELNPVDLSSHPHVSSYRHSDRRKSTMLTVSVHKFTPN